MEDKLYGFRYAWLEPSMQPEFDDGDPFVLMAQDIARITIVALQRRYHFPDLQAVESIFKAWTPDQPKSENALIGQVIAMLDEALDCRHHSDMDRALDKLSKARDLLSQVTGVDASYLRSGDYHADIGSTGGKSRAAKIDALSTKVCQAVSHYICERKLWDDEPTIKTVKEMAWDDMNKSFEDNATWFGVTEDEFTYYGLGMNTIDQCVSASKHHFQRTGKYN